MSPEPILFNSWEQIRGGSAECQLRVGNLSAWSLPVSLETLGSTHCELFPANTHDQPR